MGLAFSTAVINCWPSAQPISGHLIKYRIFALICTLALLIAMAVIYDDENIAAKDLLVIQISLLGYSLLLVYFLFAMYFVLRSHKNTASCSRGFCWFMGALYPLTITFQLVLVIGGQVITGLAYRHGSISFVEVIWHILTNLTSGILIVVDMLFNYATLSVDMIPSLVFSLGVYFVYSYCGRITSGGWTYDGFVTLLSVIEVVLFGLGLIAASLLISYGVLRLQHVRDRRRYGLMTSQSILV